MEKDSIGRLLYQNGTTDDLNCARIVWIKDVCPRCANTLTASPEPKPTLEDSTFPGTGWRLLKVGEKLLPDDEVWLYPDEPRAHWGGALWPNSGTVGGDWRTMGTYRRKISTEPK